MQYYFIKNRTQKYFRNYENVLKYVYENNS